MPAVSPTPKLRCRPYKTWCPPQVFGPNTFFASSHSYTHIVLRTSTPGLALRYSINLAVGRKGSVTSTCVGEG